MSGHRSRGGRTVRLALVPTLVLAASAGLIRQASYAAFDPSADRTPSAGAAQVQLTDDDHGAALFAPNGPIVPGASGTQCIEVTSTAAGPGAVRMYLSDLVPSAHGIEQHLLLTVEQGGGATFGSCAGFVADASGTIIDRRPFADAAARFDDYASGVGSWVTHGDTTGESKSYRVSWVFDTTGMSQADENGLMGETTGLTFRWELQGD